MKATSLKNRLLLYSRGRTRLSLLLLQTVHKSLSFPATESAKPGRLVEMTRSGRLLPTPRISVLASFRSPRRPFTGWRYSVLPGWVRVCPFSAWFFFSSVFSAPSCRGIDTLSSSNIDIDIDPNSSPNAAAGGGSGGGVKPVESPSDFQQPRMDLASLTNLLLLTFLIQSGVAHGELPL